MLKSMNYEAPHTVFSGILLPPSEVQIFTIITHGSSILRNNGNKCPETGFVNGLSFSKLNRNYVVFFFMIPCSLVAGCMVSQPERSHHNSSPAWKPKIWVQLLLKYFQNTSHTDPLVAYARGYEDYLQCPLQPLMDNLESQTYEVFEKDPVKYNEYQRAIYGALLDMIMYEEKDSKVA